MPLSNAYQFSKQKQQNRLKTKTQSKLEHSLNFIDQTIENAQFKFKFVTYQGINSKLNLQNKIY